jgi:hypothetical protein
VNRLWRCIVTASACLLGCRNPVNDDRIAARGGEQPGVRTGPLHRPGQPCTVCHSSAGGRHPEFSLAGTVFKAMDSLEPAAGAVVQVIDAGGVQKYFTANAAGNFYASTDEWSPSFPLWTACAYACGSAPGGYVRASMQTQIFRSASCADCHSDPVGPTSSGHIYLAATVADLCP